MKADSLFWIFGMIAVVLASHACYTLIENEFYLAAVFGIASSFVWLYSNDEGRR